MAFTNQPQLMYFFPYLDNNAIEDEGVSYLITIKFIKLNNLNLGKNMITDAGGQKVVDGQWHGIMSLNLWGN